MLGEGLLTSPLRLTERLPIAGAVNEAGDLRSGVAAGSETRAEPR